MNVIPCIEASAALAKGDVCPYNDAMKFELITPAAQAASLENTTYVALPGDDGDFGVMPGHMPLISTLRDGQVVEVTDNAGHKSRFQVTGAFADVQPHAVTILAETATAA